MYIRIPLSQQQAIPAAPGNQMEWNFRSVVPKIGAMHLALAAIEFDVKLDVTGAGSASPIAGPVDWPLFFSSVDLSRAPDKHIWQGLTGWQLFVLSCQMQNGYQPGLWPATFTPGSGGGAVVATWRWRIPFERPFSTMDRFDFCPPLASFVKQGKIKIIMNSSAGGVAGISFTDALGSIDVNLITVPVDSLSFPPDLRWESVSDAATGTKRGLSFPRGIYRDLIYCPPLLGGQGATPAKFAGTQIDGSKSGQANQFPAAQLAPAAGVAGPTYLETWMDGNVLDVGSARNMVAAGNYVPLYSQGPGQELTKSRFLAGEDFNLDVNMTGQVQAAGHQFLIARSFPQALDEQASTVTAAGIDPNTVQTIPDYKQALNPPHPGNLTLLPQKVIPKGSATGRQVNKG